MNFATWIREQSSISYNLIRFLESVAYYHRELLDVISMSYKIGWYVAAFGVYIIYLGNLRS